MTEAGARRLAVAVVAVAALIGAALVALRLTVAERGIASARRAMEANDLVTAEAEWREVLSEDPSRAEALYGLGWTLHLAGRSDLARQAFERCVEENPDDPLGYKGLGSVAMADGNPVLARRRLEEALARAPGDLAIRQSLALLDLTTGRVDEAAAAFEALATEAPDRPELRQALAEARLAQGRAEDAMAEADRALVLAKEPRTVATAAMTRARALLAASAGRVDKEDCARTAPPVYTWLEAADQALDVAEASGASLPDLTALRRAVRQRRGATDDLCPGLRATSVGKEFPGG